MRSGTLILIVAANAVIAVGIVAVALTVFPAGPESIPETVADTRSSLEVADLQDDVAVLKGKIQVLEDTAVMRSEDLAASRKELASLREKLESLPSGTPGVDPSASPEDQAADKAARDAQRAMFRGMARGARNMGRQILESIANPTEQSIQMAESRVRRDAQRLGRRLNLPETRVAQVEQALMDVDRRTRDKMKATIDAKGIDNVTFEDAKPLIDESFREREQAMASVLDEKELETFKAQDAQGRAMVDMGMRMAFPAKSAEGGENK